MPRYPGPMYRLALLLAAPSQAAAPPPLPRIDVAQSGDRQSALFARRLDALAERIERQRLSGRLPRGPATFMQQDLARVWRGITVTLARAPRLGPQELASYAAMIRRVELRLIRIEGARDASPRARPAVSRRTAGPAFRAAS